MQIEFHQLSTKYEFLRARNPGLHTRLLASLAAEGQLSPVFVVRGNSGADALVERFVLIDGYHRVRALMRLGRDSVEALLLELDEVEALIFRQTSQHMPTRSALEEGWLLRELIEGHALNQRELSQKIQRSKSWVSRRLSLVRELPESVQDLVRKGALCAHGAMKFLVPLARANKSQSEELAKNIRGHRTSSREMEQIYHAWKKADKRERKNIVARPLLYLKTAQEMQREPVAEGSNVIGELVQQMHVVGAICARLRRTIVAIKQQEDTRAFHTEPMRDAWRDARIGFRRLEKLLQEKKDVGSGHTCDDFSSPR